MSGASGYQTSADLPGRSAWTDTECKDLRQPIGVRGTVDSDDISIEQGREDSLPPRCECNLGTTIANPEGAFHYSHREGEMKTMNWTASIIIPVIPPSTTKYYEMVGENMRCPLLERKYRAAPLAAWQEAILPECVRVWKEQARHKTAAGPFCLYEALPDGQPEYIAVYMKRTVVSVPRMAPSVP